MISALQSERKEIRARRETSVSTPRTTVGIGTYSGMQHCARQGADDHQKIPSLMGDRRYYRDGRVEGND